MRVGTRTSLRFFDQSDQLAFFLPVENALEMPDEASHSIAVFDQRFKGNRRGFEDD
ncbi:MAG: hypothetical protein ABGX04_16630 [Myxococcales bacterium]